MGALSAIYVPFDFAALLGAVEPLHEARRKRALSHIVPFLYKIREVRRV